MKAILVAVTTKYDKYDIDYSLDELARLCEAIDIEVAFKVTQNLDVPNAKTYVGKGKLEEIKSLITEGIEMVIFNDELSPSALSNISSELNVLCIDRTYLILKIFEQRAQTNEAYLEIKLAKDLYLYPRLNSIREAGERNMNGGGSFASKGKGETEAELDRRHLRSEISHIRKKLQDLKEMKLRQITKRKQNKLPIVALVGYTNAGKSSTMNSILENEKRNNKMVFEKNQLFATLSTYNRKVCYKNREFILVDTVGFVSKLPHDLVDSFYETLLEIKNADLIIHVIDASSIYAISEFNVVNQVLDSLMVQKIPTLNLLNKWDKVIEENKILLQYSGLEYSNRTGLNLDKLLDQIVMAITPKSNNYQLLIPYENIKIANELERVSIVKKKEYQEYGIFFDVDIPISCSYKFECFDINVL